MLERKVTEVGRFEAHWLPDESVVYFDPGAHSYFGEVRENPKANGGYSAVEKSRLIGVSGPAKVLDSNPDPLMGWAAKLDQTGIADLYIRACRDGGDLSWLSTQESIYGALREAKLTWRDIRQATAERGTNVHEQILLALAREERPPSLSRLTDEERGYGQAAMRWWQDCRPEPLYAEQVTMVGRYGFAGRFDLLAEIEGQRVLVDCKTREKGVARKADHVQLAGYNLANIECKIGEADRLIALVLKPDGTYLEVESVATHVDFLHALDAYRASHKLDARLRAAEKAEAKGQGALA